MKATPEKKANIGTYAAEHRVVNAIQRYDKDFVSSFTLNGLKKTEYCSWLEEPIPD